MLQETLHSICYDVKTASWSTIGLSCLLGKKEKGVDWKGEVQKPASSEEQQEREG